MQKKTLAIALIALLGAPMAIYIIVNTVRAYIPPSEAAIKTPYQFEAAFNEVMAPHGMSIDLEQVEYRLLKDYAEKVVPLQCADGSDIKCRIVTTSTRRKCLIVLLEFEQPYDGAIPPHTKQLFEMLLRVFETPLYEDQTANYHFSTYQDKTAEYDAFFESDESKAYINVSSHSRQSETFVIERIQKENEEQGMLLLELRILTSRLLDW